jgi:predicted acyltransferase
MVPVPQPLVEKEPAVSPRTGTRLVSLDAFRGFTMFWIVGGVSLVAGVQALGNNTIIEAVIYQFRHSRWEGIRYYDLIWPCFMLMVGAAIPFALAKRSQMETRRQMHLQALRRAAVLFLLGSLRASISSNTPTLVELSSALQPIAIAYLVAHFLAFTSTRIQAAAGAAILAGYAALLAFVPAPGVPAGTYIPNQNLVTAVDIAVLGRAHPDAWGTVLSTIPTIATTIAGLLVGKLLMGSATERTKMFVLGVAGLTGITLGTLLGIRIPVVMKLWTTSYGILSMGWACLIFLLFYWLIDVRGYRKLGFPFAIIGMNALAIYVSKSIVPLGRIVGIFTGGPDGYLGSFAPLARAVLVIAIEWLVLYWMYKRRIFLRA